jgi:two-component system OmpR family response regulator
MNDDQCRTTAEPADFWMRGRRSPAHRILVAYDEPLIRRLITAALTGSGYHVDNVENGAVAWEALQAKTYDLLITDHIMPKVTGVELVKNLRSARMALPVVMVAGQSPVDELPSLHLSATLFKPFVVAELLDTVENVLRPTDSPREETHSLPDSRYESAESDLWL